MANALPSLKDYGKKGFGFVGFLDDSKNLQRLTKIIVSLFREIAKEFFELNVLRAVIATSNVIEEYNRLLLEISRKTRLEAPRERMLVGKVLTWGDCDSPETYFVVVIINEAQCASAVLEDEGKTYIAHEFAHVAEGFYTIDRFFTGYY